MIFRRVSAVLLSASVLWASFSLTPHHASANSTQTTLAVKFVELTSKPDPKPALSREQAADVIRVINQEYAPCGMKLVLGDYEKIDSEALGLPYNLQSMDQLEAVRAAFSDPRYLVIVNTGPWNHDEMGPANAWTAMPGDLPAGAVLEGSVATDAPVVAHELGHYLGLEHVSDLSDMMNPVIYSDSTTIFAGQCQEMRKTAHVARTLALR